jgi:hypothetical protein
MNDRIDRVPLKDAIERRAIAYVAVNELWPAAGDALNPVDYYGRAVAQVVDDDRHPSGGDYLDAGMRTDVAGASRE